MTRFLLACGVLAGPVFVLVFLIDGATRPGYDPLAMPISVLARGTRGWLQTINFLVAGSLLVGFSVGLRRASAGEVSRSTLGTALLATVGLGLIGAGLFAVPDDRHFLASLVVLIGMPVTCFAHAAYFRRRGMPAWAAYSLATGVLAIAGAVGVLIAFSEPGGLARYGGLIQRATVVVWFAWVTLFAVSALRAEASETPTPAF